MPDVDHVRHLLIPLPTEGGAEVELCILPSLSILLTLYIIEFSPNPYALPHEGLRLLFEPEMACAPTGE